MFRITDVLILGTEYSIVDEDDNIINVLQIIQNNDILDAAMGDYDESEFTGISQYLEQSVSMLSGFDQVDPYRVYWYATSEEEVVISDIIEYAIQHGYNKIILEYLEPLN